MGDDRKHSSWVARNREPILTVLQRVLPRSGSVLELASGSGEHAAFFAPRFPLLTWLPTDIEPASLVSIRAWRDHVQVDNLLQPVAFDVHSEHWPVEEVDVVVAMNLIHIAPWSVCEALMRGAGRVLRDRGLLFLYGPFLTTDTPTAPSNLKFDEDLRRRNPAWGVRNIDDVKAVAEQHGLVLQERVEMPANNLSVVFRRERSGPRT